MRLLTATMIHLATVTALIGIEFFLLLSTAASDTWYTPMEPDGDPEGYTVAAVEALVFLAAPVTVVVYAVALAVAGRVHARRNAEFASASH